MVHVKKYYRARFNRDVDFSKEPPPGSFDARLGIAFAALAGIPDGESDVEIETFEYKGFKITILQCAESVASDVPTYFATAANLASKDGWGFVLTDDFNSIDKAVANAKSFVDKRKRNRNKKNPE